MYLQRPHHQTALVFLHTKGTHTEWPAVRGHHNVSYRRNPCPRTSVLQPSVHFVTQSAQINPLALPARGPAAHSSICARPGGDRTLAYAHGIDFYRCACNHMAADPEPSKNTRPSAPLTADSYVRPLGYSLSQPSLPLLRVGAILHRPCMPEDTKGVSRPSRLAPKRAAGALGPTYSALPTRPRGPCNCAGRTRVG